MSESNVELMRRAYERFKAHGTPNPELAAPGFVWDMTNMVGWPEQQTYEGQDGMLRFLAQWTEPFDDWGLEVESLHESGDKVVALLRQHGRSKMTGLAVDMSFAQVWTFREGRYARMDMYSDTEKALADAGVGP
ncbi:MAG TPA: nuclear transport factor 2 family protein [Solirubrobacteraceae bacterium]|jgi:ketosteroid isomerase-like protein